MIEMLCQFFGAFNIEQFEKIFEKHQVKTGKFNPSTIADQTVRSFAEKYESAKQKAEAIDFEDMLIYSAILENYLCRRDRIDEFQDISLRKSRCFGAQDYWNYEKIRPLNYSTSSLGMLNSPSKNAPHSTKGLNSSEGKRKSARRLNEYPKVAILVRNNSEVKEIKEMLEFTA